MNKDLFIVSPEDTTAEVAAKKFLTMFLVSEGTKDDGFGSSSNFRTFVIEQSRFNNSLLRLIKSLPLLYNETLQRQTHFFSKFGIGIPTNSAHDCSGQLCRYSQEVHVVDDGYNWIIVVETRCSYDV